MPYIETVTNVKITAEQEKSLKEKLGKAIETIPGKTEKWLMLNFRDGERLYFHGDNNMPICYSEVKIFGQAESGDLEKLTRVLCGIYEEELGVSPENTYVKYEFIDEWGWNNMNF